MEHDKDDRKRPHLRLVVDNAEKRNPRPAEGEELPIPLDELIARREDLRIEFYAGIERWQAKAFAALERHLTAREIPYGLDPSHGRLMVIPAGAVCPEAAEPVGSQQDELLIYLAEDIWGTGGCISLEMVLPFFSDDDGVMEDALIYSPMYQYGALFLEENRQDGLLDLVYRLGFPVYPPALTMRFLERFFGAAANELKETLRILAEYAGD